MSSFLELCQMTARQSGTIHDPMPATVVGQVRRLQLIVEYVREAYIDIQNAHRAWRWLQSEFTQDMLAGTSSYAGTDFDDERTGTPITRFSQWGVKQDTSDISLSMYLTSAGPQEEGPLRWRPWDDFYAQYLRGVVPANKPQVYSIRSDDKLIIAPVLDADYTFRGRYRKSPQILAADADIPEMPVEFHTIIKDAALCYVEGFDEGPRIPVYRLRMLPNWSMLEAQQLPRVKWGAALA